METQTAQTAPPFNALHQQVTLAGLPTYPSITEIAEATGTDRRWVTRQGRRLKLFAVNADQRDVEWRYTMADTVRLLLLAKLQCLLGQTSAVPFELIAAAGPAIDRLLQRPDEATTLTLRDGGALTLFVEVPGLNQLLGASASLVPAS